MATGIKDNLSHASAQRSNRRVRSVRGTTAMPTARARGFCSDSAASVRASIIAAASASHKVRSRAPARSRAGREQFSLLHWLLH